jgi:heparanase
MSQNAVNPASVPRIGTIEERFQAYNVEMLEVTGGRFWKPYKDVQREASKQSASQQSTSTPVGMNPNLYQYRPPIDLSNPRLENSRQL